MNEFQSIFWDLSFEIPVRGGQSRLSSQYFNCLTSLNQIKSNRAYIAHFLQLNATQLPLHLITETDPAITSVLHVF